MRGTRFVSFLGSHCQWDAVWVADAINAGIRIRTPLSLGRKRSWLERSSTWAAEHLHWSRLIAAVLWIALFASVVYLCWMLGNRVRQLMPLVAAIVFTIPWMLMLFDWGGIHRMLACCAMRQRVRCLRHPLAPALAQELLDRREYWLSRLQDSQSLPTSVAMNRHSLVLRLLWCGWVAGSAYVCVMSKLTTSANTREIPLWFQMVLLAGWAGIVAIDGMRGRQERKRLKRSLSDNECPDCSYKIDPGPPFQLGSGANIYAGQPRCSECGCRWPLVPPPVWIVQTEQGESRWNGVGNLRPISKTDR